MRVLNSINPKTIKANELQVGDLMLTSNNEFKPVLTKTKLNSSQVRFTLQADKSQSWHTLHQSDKVTVCDDRVFSGQGFN